MLARKRNSFVRAAIADIARARANALSRRMYFGGKGRGREGGLAAVNCTPDKTRKQLFNLIRSTCAARSIFTFILPARRMQRARARASLEHASFVDRSITKLVSSHGSGPMAHVCYHEIQFRTWCANLTAT